MNRERIAWIDTLKVVATFSVILLHCASPILYKLNDIDILYWQVGNSFDSSVRFAVPLFFMISGFLLFNKKVEETNVVFFKKRLLKVAIPLFAWSIVYILFKKYILNYDISILAYIIKIFYEKQYFHLWFMYVILGIYLFVPLLRIYIYKYSIDNVYYLIVLWIIFIVSFPQISKMIDSKSVEHIFAIPKYIGYLAIGYILGNFTISRKVFQISMIFIVLSTLFIIVSTYSNSIKINKFYSFYYTYTSLPVLIQSVSWFIFIKFIARVIDNSSILTLIIKKISLCSLGIYLVHPIVMYFLEHKLNMYALNGNNPIYMIPITALFTLSSSFFTIYLIQKIPILNNIISPK